MTNVANYCYFLMLLVMSGQAISQPFYTRIRGAFGVESFGITPKGAISADAAFSYYERTFWNLQAGIGVINRGNFRSPTLSSAITHCLILNPYKRKSCYPHPGNYLIESFFEAGTGGFLVDRYDNIPFTGIKKQRLLAPSGIIGFRFNIISRQWIYIVKLRYTVPLLANPLASHAGAGISVGWR
ncbi:hypothetical protein [Dyadobacter sandarakinus]|uniref:Conjugative transposon protein TraO n=1 Tax=Dyadobacter sandarakinus TaxID=2747268 RepID=A0ABX7I286_9BACT|nr:hypothetical protein [Dyadobacter sandarakinus]QRR00159.1 hypothetical protein HWI92_04190 [Dyadobacter sandarakinus]